MVERTRPRSTSRGTRERLRDGVGRRGGEHREAQRGVEEGGGGRQVQRPSKLVTKKLRLDRERALRRTEKSFLPCFLVPFKFIYG